MTIRKVQMIAAAIAVLVCSQLQAEERVEKVGDWKMTIAPAENGPKKMSKDAVDPAEYQRVYRSIPFNRAEYTANPGYRHDATMDILFGERTTSVVKQVQSTRTVAPSRRTVPYRFNNDIGWPNRRRSIGSYFLWNARGLY